MPKSHSKKKVKKVAVSDSESDNDLVDVPKPLTYTDRLVAYIEDNCSQGTSVNEVCVSIRRFQTNEFEKKRANGNVMPFGKYKGRKVQQVVAFDKQYCKWLLSQDMMDNFVELKTSIKKLI
jgi:uncharacterized protein (DUF3820 family)